MKAPSISCLREKSFRKFTFAAGDILLPRQRSPRVAQNPFKTFELAVGTGGQQTPPQQSRPKNYKSCEKEGREGPQLQKQDSQGCVPAKPLKSCKSLSSTELGEEIDFEQKKITDPERSPLGVSLLPPQPSTAQIVGKGSDKGPVQNQTDKLSGQLTLSNHSSKSMGSGARSKQFKVLRFSGRAEVFEVVRFLDRGSFGDVFLVRHVLTKMLFSLKTIQRSKLTEKQINQLVQEVKIQSSLNHPSIVKLYAFTADKQYIYLLLEACLGENLYQALKGKTLGEGTARDHVRRVCEAVEYLHERHIMHRDIKSQNILLEGGTAKLCDFGWAAHTPLLRNTKCGTPVYTPPEMVRMQHYSNKVDVWCIGVLTYQLLFGVLPFEIRYMQDFAKITHQEVSFPKVPAVSQEAKSFIAQCLAKEPGERMTIKQALAHSFLARKQNDFKAK